MKGRGAKCSVAVEQREAEEVRRLEMGRPCLALPCRARTPLLKPIYLRRLDPPFCKQTLRSERITCERVPRPEEARPSSFRPVGGQAEDADPTFSSPTIRSKADAK